MGKRAKNPPAGLPLEGITVIELAGPPGAWAGGILAEFGARVIKVTRAGALPVRWGPTGMRYLTSPEEEVRYAAFNPFDRNKESIRLDLKTAGARDVFYKLVESADVVTEGYRPGVARRLGVDYETLDRINPRIIYCAITGYGQNGPYKDMVGHDINYSAIAGLSHLTGPPDSPPSPCAAYRWAIGEAASPRSPSGCCWPSWPASAAGGGSPSTSRLPTGLSV